MGIDYSYDIVCRSEQLWALLESVDELSARSVKQGKIKIRTRSGNSEHSFETFWRQSFVFQDEVIERLSFDTSLFFPWDEDILQYFRDDQRSTNDHDRAPIGSIYVYVSPAGSDEVGLTGTGDVSIRFTAATTHMSVLFEVSASIRETFVNLARAQGDGICVLDREGQNIVLWCEDQPRYEVVVNHRGTRADIKRQVRATEIGRELRRSAEGTFAREVFNRALRDSDPQVRAVAIREFGTESIVNSTALSLALTQDADVEVRICAAEALGKFPYGEGQRALISALQDSGPAVRSTACTALARSSWNDASPLIAPMLKDEDGEVRSTAAKSLAKKATPSVIPALLEALQDEDLIVATYMAQALGRLRATEAVEPLCAGLFREDNYFVQDFTQALASIADPRAVPALIRLLNSDGECHNMGAALALGIIGDPRALEPLRAALETAGANTQTREDIEWSLKRIEALHGIGSA